jgi:hypothetical protein
MDGLEKLTVAQAAALLGTSQDAVRKRIQRNTIKWDKDDSGHIHVYLDPSETSQATDQDESKTSVEILRGQVAYLQEVIRTRDEEIRRRDHLLAAALERIPAIEAPPDSSSSEPRGDPQTAAEEPGEGRTAPKAEKPASWWRKLLFG